MPRRRSIIDFLQQAQTSSIPVGFSGGFTQGLYSTLPLMAQTSTREMSLRELLNELMRENMRLTTELAKERLQGEVKREQALYNILENYVPLTTYEPTTARPTIEVEGRKFGLLTPEEIERVMKKEEITAPIVGSIPKWMITPLYQTATLGIKGKQSEEDMIVKESLSILNKYFDVDPKTLKYKIVADFIATDEDKKRVFSILKPAYETLKKYRPELANLYFEALRRLAEEIK